MNEKKSEIIFYGNLNGKNIQGYAYSVYGIGGGSTNDYSQCRWRAHALHID